MSHNPAHKYLSIPIAHNGNDLIIVATDVEHRIRCSVVCTGKALPQTGEVDAPRMLGYGVPVAQGLSHSLTHASVGMRDEESLSTTIARVEKRTGNGCF